MIKTKSWITIEHVPALIEKMKGRLVIIGQGVETLMTKKGTKKLVGTLIKNILANEEDFHLIRALAYCHTHGGLEKYPSKLITEVEHLTANAKTHYQNILNLKDPRFESIKNYLEHTIREADSELITKSMDGLHELYEIALIKGNGTDGPSKELCFTAFQTAAGLYRYLENKENCFLKKRLGIYENELSIINLTTAIKDSCKEVFKNFLGNSNKCIDDIHFMGDLKLRKSFEESKKNVIAFYEEINPEFGEIAKAVVENNLLIFNKTETLHAVECYRRMPRLIVPASSKLKDEVGLVHELAHAIHFVLSDNANPISNTPMNTLVVEYVPAFFELLFLFSEYKKEKRPKVKKQILEYIYHYFTLQFYSQTFMVEVENLIWLEIGDSVKSPEQLSRVYHKSIKDFYGGIVEIKTENKHDWLYHHNIFSPQLDLTYLLSFIYGYHSFIRYQSFRMTTESLKEFLSKGSDADINSIFSLHDFFMNPHQYIKEIIDSLAEYNRES